MEFRRLEKLGRYPVLLTWTFLIHTSSINESKLSASTRSYYLLTCHHTEIPYQQKEIYTPRLTSTRLEGRVDWSLNTHNQRGPGRPVSDFPQKKRKKLNTPPLHPLHNPNSQPQPPSIKAACNNSCPASSIGRA